MEKVSWMDKKTNEQVLREVGEERRLLQSVEKRKRNWIGHVVRGERLMKKVVEGRMKGKRGKGRPREGMISELKGDSYGKMKRMAEDREVWRSYEPWTCYKIAEN